MMGSGGGHNGLAARRRLISRFRDQGRRQWMAADAKKVTPQVAEAAEISVMLMGRRKWKEFHAHL
jgi:hypothetical protein